MLRARESPAALRHPDRLDRRRTRSPCGSHARELTPRMAARRSRSSTLWRSPVGWSSGRSPARRSTPTSQPALRLEHRLLHDVRVTAVRPAGSGSCSPDRPVGARAEAERRADVVVSTYPGSTEVVGRLRRRGRLRSPRRGGDHRPRRARLLGAPRCRPAPRHAGRSDPGGARDRRAGRRRRARPRTRRPAVRRPALARGGAARARPPGRRAGRGGVGRRLGGRRSGRRRRGGARAAGRVRARPGRQPRRRASGARGSLRRSAAVRVLGFTDRMPESSLPPTC